MLETVTCVREDILTMEEPQAFASAVADVLEKHPQGHVAGVLHAMVSGHRRNQARRAAVLSHPDLCERLVKELGYTRATNWNGFMPPAVVNWGSEPELCRTTGRNGVVRFNQLGRYAVGELPNNSDQRRVIVELSRIARERMIEARSVVDGSDPRGD